MANERYKQGLKIRREVVGSDQVDEWLNESDYFTAPLEEIITEFGWGTIWARPGLSRQTKSLLTIVLISIIALMHLSKCSSLRAIIMTLLEC